MASTLWNQIAAINLEFIFYLRVMWLLDAHERMAIALVVSNTNKNFMFEKSCANFQKRLKTNHIGHPFLLPSTCTASSASAANRVKVVLFSDNFCM